jgi:short-subunit dehydrogenase
MNHPIKGKVVLITGASSGIGAATARRLAQDGMRLTLAARRLDRLETVAAEVAALGGEALIVQTDVTKRDELQRMIQATDDRWGRIDVLLNNAGMGHDKPLYRMKSEKIHDEIHLNLIAVIECAQLVLPIMLRQKSGHIINVASIAGLIATPGSTIYSASKFGVNGFSDALRRELHDTGIFVSAFCPGFTPTELSPVLKAIAEGQSTAMRVPGLMPVTYVADQIAHLIRRPRNRVIIPPAWRLLVALAVLLPGVADMLMPILLNKRKIEKE